MKPSRPAGRHGAVLQRFQTRPITGLCLAGRLGAAATAKAVDRTDGLAGEQLAEPISQRHDRTPTGVTVDDSAPNASEPAETRSQCSAFFRFYPPAPRTCAAGLSLIVRSVGMARRASACRGW